MSTVAWEVEQSYAAVAVAGGGKVAVALERTWLHFAGAGSGKGRRLGGARRGGDERWYSNLVSRCRGRVGGAAGGMQVFVRTPDGRSLALDVAPSDTVDKVKAMVERRERVAAARQRLVFAGRHLDDGRRTLAECGVGKEATLHLLLRLRGGLSRPPTTASPSRATITAGLVAVGCAALVLTCFPPEAGSGGLGAAVDFSLWAIFVAGVNLITAGLCQDLLQSLIRKAVAFARRNLAVLAISAASSAGDPALCFAVFALFLVSMVLAMAVTR